MSVKLATKDTTEASDQASDAVNATGNSKKPVKQVFHPGLFMRARSAPMSNISSSDSEDCSNEERDKGNIVNKLTKLLGKAVT